MNALDAHDRDMRVALVCSVQSYDAAKQRVSVQPLTQRPFIDAQGTEGVESRPVISDIPVAFQRGGGFMLTFPLQQGDEGLLVFSDQSLDIWKQQGGNVDPIDLRTHHLSDALFIPGPCSNPNALQSADPSVIAMGQDGAASDYVATAQRTLDQLNTIVSNLQSLAAAFASWTPVPDDGGAALKVILSALIATPWPSTVSSPASMAVKILG